MMEIFLGNPPPAIKKWIMENSGSTPPAGAERWVEACNPDGSPLSDIEHAEWVFSDGNAHNAMLLDWSEYGDGIYWIIDRTRGMFEPVFCISNDGSLIPGSVFTDLDEAKTAVQIHKTDIEYGTTLSAYRKYTPGHWEDADGNWINGSWSNWSGWHLMNDGTKTEFTDVDIESGYINFFPSEDEGPDRWTIMVDDTLTFPNVDNPNMLYLFFGPEYSSGCAIRTWNNTKPAPAA